MTRSIQKQLKTRLERRKQKKDQKKKDIHKRVQSVAKKYTSRSSRKTQYEDTDSSSRDDTEEDTESSSSESERSSSRSSSDSNLKSKKSTRRKKNPSAKESKRSSQEYSGTSKQSTKRKQKTNPSREQTAKKEKSKTPPRERSDRKRPGYDDGLPPFKSSTYNDIDYPEPSRFRPLPSFSKPSYEISDDLVFNQDPLVDALRMKREREVPVHPVPSDLHRIENDPPKDKFLGTVSQEDTKPSEEYYNLPSGEVSNKEIPIDSDQSFPMIEKEQPTEPIEKVEQIEDMIEIPVNIDSTEDTDKPVREEPIESKEPVEPAEPVEQKGKNFDEEVMKNKFKYEYEQEEEEEPEEFYNSKRIEEFINEKGFMLLEYFTVGRFCSFILIQLPTICETVMIYINRHRFPIDVSGSMYRKTALEKLKVDKVDQDTNDYENMSLPGFDSTHVIDKMTDTNKQQKNLTYYVHRQISRLLYITQNIEIKPCILLNGVFGFYEMYHMPNRLHSKEFYPVISLEILFSKTFMLEKNIPVFYQKFYTILNHSNRNKLEYLMNSLSSAMEKIRLIRVDMQKLQTKEKDKDRIKQLVKHIEQRTIQVDQSRATLSSTDVVSHSYQTRKMNEEIASLERKREECNILYTDVKKVYDRDVFDQEITLHELYYKIRDIEELIDYLQ